MSGVGASGPGRYAGESSGRQTRRPTGESHVATSFRKKPVVIEAVQWTGLNYREVYALYDPDGDKDALRGEFGSLFIPTLEGEMRADPGDWIVRGVKGEFYPVKPDIFEETYEPA